MNTVETLPSWSVSQPAAAPSWHRPEPSEELFHDLARNDPAELVALLSSGTLPPHLLTFAAEIAGDCPPRFYPAVRSVLLGLLGHPSSTVREGVVYGLSKLMHALPALRDVLMVHTEEAGEPSPGVRAAARGVLGLAY